MEIQFPTDAPINIERISGQNKRLYEYLKAGNKITVFSEAVKRLKIGYLNSRISDLKNKFKLEIESKFTAVYDGEEEVTVKEYWLKQAA